MAAELFLVDVSRRRREIPVRASNASVVGGVGAVFV